MTDLLEEIFNRAAAFEASGRHVDYIRLDMSTRQVEVKLTAVPGGEYFETILAQQQDTIQQALSGSCHLGAEARQWRE